MLRPYFDLFRDNPLFRRLFAALSLSQLGDWFNLIAVFTLLRDVAVNPIWGITLLFLIKQLPAIFVTAFAGRLADRLSRQKILVSCDLVRAALLCLLLIAGSYGSIPLIFILLIGHSLASAFFDPTIQAFLPDVVQSKDLISAQALRSIVWTSTMILGAFLGGLITEHCSWQTAIIVDLCSFVAAATIVRSLKVRSNARATGITTTPTRISSRSLWQAHPHLRPVIIARPLYGLGAAMYVILTLTGQNFAQVQSSGAMAVGLLYVARGTGALLGPLVIRSIVAPLTNPYRRALFLGFAGTATGWLLFSTTTSFLECAIAAGIAHFFGQVISVFAFTVLQQEAPAEYRGQIFGLENMVFSYAYVFSLLGYGILLSNDVVTLPEATFILGLIWAIPAAYWWWSNVIAHRPTHGT